MAVALPDLRQAVRESAMMQLCPWCGGAFEPAAGETHAYMLSSPECWAAYGELLSREYQNAVLFGQVHRLTVDAYALQHPGDPGDRRARQSFWIHGASLWLVLRLGRSHAEATAALKHLAQGDFSEPPRNLGFAITHADVLAASEAEHASLVRKWADAALAGCKPAHSEFERLAARASFH